ncbi:carboxymuconolactone decarboxylase family protein [Thalassobaculum sp.]|uniref:carboxymuconolactone decarboxylase family protein n=1 Tax=Thalassobaculum sp. TaxID=2022740 RepID=UPI0032EEFA2B
MARVRDVGIEEVPADVQPIYARFAAEYGPFMNQVKVFAHRPIALKHIMGMLLENADNPILEKRHLEIAIVTVSEINKCTYCVAHHGPKLLSVGLTRETVDRILEPDCPGLTEVDRLVRDYAAQVTHDHNRVRDTMFDALRQHFTEEQIVELTLRITLCTFFNKFNDVMQLEMEDDALAYAGIKAAE